MSMSATRFKFDWNAENIEKLTTMLKDGVQTSRIASELGCSPMAVVGKAHRLGLRGNGKKPAVSKPSRAPKAVKIVEQHAVRQILAERPPVREVVSEDEYESSVALIDLQYWHCRAPFSSDGGARYCGKRKQDGSSYCPEHHLRFTQRAYR